MRADPGLPLSADTALNTNAYRFAESATSAQMVVLCQVEVGHVSRVLIAVSANGMSCQRCRPSWECQRLIRDAAEPAWAAGGEEVTARALFYT